MCTTYSVYVYIYICVCAHAHTHTHVCIHIYVYIYVCIYIYIYICICICIMFNRHLRLNRALWHCSATAFGNAQSQHHAGNTGLRQSRSQAGCDNAGCHNARCWLRQRCCWLQTNGANTNGAAAKVIVVARLGKKVCPGTFVKINVGSREYPKSPSVRKHEPGSDPISADPICPFPRLRNR